MIPVNPLGRRLFLLIAMFSVATASCFGSVIQLYNGNTYSDVSIVKRDANTIQVVTQFGQVSIPLSMVDTIDGVSIHPIPTPSPTPTPVPPPAVSSSVSPSLAAASPIRAASVPAEAEPTAASPWPPYQYRWNMDIVLVVFALFSAIWIGTVGSVQRSLFERRVDPRFWTNIAILLPGLGYCMYQLFRKLAQLKERRAARRNVNESVAVREKENARHRSGFKLASTTIAKPSSSRNRASNPALSVPRIFSEEALLERASDVHIDPAENDYLVRFRIDGIMQSRMTFNRDEGVRVVSALKTLAQIDVAEKRKSQDGRFQVRTDEDDIDFRVATASSIFGEKVVVRILNRNSGLLGLGDSGHAGCHERRVRPSHPFPQRYDSWPPAPPAPERHRLFTPR